MDCWELFFSIPFLSKESTTSCSIFSIALLKNKCVRSIKQSALKLETSFSKSSNVNLDLKKRERKMFNYLNLTSFLNKVRIFFGKNKKRKRERKEREKPIKIRDILCWNWNRNSFIGIEINL